MWLETKYPPTQRFDHVLGYLDYGELPFDYRYEFEEEDSPFWGQAERWIFVDVLRASEKFKGHGKKILEDFLATLPKGTGVVANANPLDQDLDFPTLQNWYKKQGFTEISPTNFSLYRIE
jgi:hypothetical protein